MITCMPALLCAYLDQFDADPRNLKAADRSPGCLPVVAGSLYEPLLPLESDTPSLTAIGRSWPPRETL
jgi:hypothetical protein